MDEFARRDFLTAAAAVATVAVAAPAYASGHADPGHQHAGTHIDLARSAADCLVSGDICIATASASSRRATPNSRNVQSGLMN